MKSSDKLLKSALTANAVFSAFSAIALLILPVYFQELLSVSFPLWPLGIGLLAWAAFVYQTARQVPISAEKTKSIIIGDLLWVLGSVLILMLDLGISTAGLWLIAIVALMVGDFALFQFIGLKKLKKG